MSDIFRGAPSGRISAINLVKLRYENSSQIIADDFFTATTNWTFPTTALNTPTNASTTEDTTPTFNFTGTSSDSRPIEYNLQVDTVNTFNSTADSYLLKYIDIPMAKAGLPTDQYYMNITSDSFSGTILGTSVYQNSADLNDWGSGFDIYTFVFSSPITITGHVKYYMSLYRTIASYDANNYLRWAYTPRPTSAEGIASKQFGSWVSPALSTVVFRYKLRTTDSTIVSEISDETTSSSSILGANSSSESYGQSFYGPENTALLDVYSDTDTGFTAGHPFTSASAIDYIVQSELPAGVYYWRVRSKDATGPITYGAWSETRTITISPGITSKVNIGGVWKDVVTRSVKIGGVWKTVTAVSTKVGGVWKDEA